MTDTSQQDDPRIFSYCSKDLIVHVDQTSVSSPFDTRLQKTWDSAMRLGFFNYQLDVRYRIIPGSKKYLLQLNRKRFTERRKAQKFSCLSHPFNPDQFNFTKIHNREVLFELNRLPLHQPVINGTEHRDITSWQDDREDAMMNEDLELRSSVIINVSPFEYGHVLIVPERRKSHSQLLTENAIQIALETVILSTNGDLRVAYNSLGALASVNHLHLHAYYLQHRIHLEDCGVEPLVGMCHELTDWPVPAFAFQLHGSSIQMLARLVYRVVRYLLTKEIAHNMYVTRGATFPHKTAPSQATIRLYLWPRKSDFGSSAATLFNVAAAELAGQIPIKDAHVFHGMTQDAIDSELSGVRLDEEVYSHVKLDIQQLLSSL